LPQPATPPPSPSVRPGRIGPLSLNRNELAERVGPMRKPN